MYSRERALPLLRRNAQPSDLRYPSPISVTATHSPERRILSLRISHPQSFIGDLSICLEAFRLRFRFDNVDQVCLSLIFFE